MMEKKSVATAIEFAVGAIHSFSNLKFPKKEQRESERRMVHDRRVSPPEERLRRGCCISFAREVNRLEGRLIEMKLDFNDRCAQSKIKQGVLAELQKHEFVKKRTNRNATAVEVLQKAWPNAWKRVQTLPVYQHKHVHVVEAIAVFIEKHYDITFYDRRKLGERRRLAA